MVQFIVSKCLILVIVGVASSTDQYLDSTLTNCITPIEHTAMLSLDVEWKKFSIKSSFLVNITCSTDKISVYKKLCYSIDATVWLSINDSRDYLLNLSLHPMEGQLYRVDIHKTKTVPILNLYLKDVITLGVYNMTVEGHCAMDFKGCFSVFPYFTDNYQKQVFISHDQNGGVAWIFPLWYNQTVETKFTLTTEHDEDYKAISHIPSQRVSTTGRKITTIFNTIPYFPIHLVALAIVPQDFIMIYKQFHYDHYGSNFSLNRRTSLWCRPEIREYITFAVYILEGVTHDLDCLIIEDDMKCPHYLRYKLAIRNWDLPYVQYIAVPDYKQRIIATPGLVFLRELDIMYHEQVSLPMQEIQVQLTVASNAIYYMFVEQFDIDQQNYFWLHDMFIKYFAFPVLYQFRYKYKLGNTQLINTYVVQNQWDFLYVEAINMNPLQDEISNSCFSYLRNVTAFHALRMVDILTMNKSLGYILKSSVKHILKKDTPPDNIWNAINATIGNVIRSQLSTNMEYTSLDKSTKDYVIKHSLDRWITQEYFELLVYRFYYSAFAELTIINCASRTVINQCNNAFLPVKYTFGSSRIKTGTVWILDNRPNVNFIILPPYIPETEYLIVNVQQTGYYRVNYDLENWKKLGRYLNSSNTLRDPVTCAQILDDAFYFLVRHTRNHIIVDIFFELASYLQQETDYIIWYPIMNALKYLSRYFPLVKGKYITNRVLKILNGFLKATVYTPFTPNFEKPDNLFEYYLRNEVLKWACVLKDVQCQEYIRALMEWHVEDPTKNKLAPGWQEWFYCQGLQIENVSYESSQIWPLLYRENDSLTTKHLEYLTCSTNEKNIIDSLCLIKQQISITLNPLDEDLPSNGNKKILNDFIFRLAKHSDTNSVLELVLNYMKIIKARIP